MTDHNVMFVCHPHSWVDVITNSSSELFTCFADSKKQVENMIKDFYPNYLNEYEPIKTIDELDEYELRTYIDYHYSFWSNPSQKFIYNVIPGFTKDEMYEKEENSKYCLLKENFIANNRERINNAIDPERKMFFLFSLDSNPNWEMQELFMHFMTRYHLG